MGGHRSVKTNQYDEERKRERKKEREEEKSPCRISIKNRVWKGPTESALPSCKTSNWHLVTKTLDVIVDKCWMMLVGLSWWWYELP